MDTGPRLSRRHLLQSTGLAATPLLLAGLAANAQTATPTRILRIVCVGGHPDDPESGAAGTMARYADLGHRVTAVYLTRGERGIPGKSLDEAAKIRSAEAEAACKIMGARARFAGQVDGAAEFTRPRLDELLTVLREEKPDILLTHWPMDSHFDHQAASLLTLRCQSALEPHPLLYFFEVNTGSQTRGFRPDVYVDITGQVERKKAALAAHVSQNGEGIWREHHEPVAMFRGREAGVKWAEAFVEHAPWGMPAGIVRN